MKNLIKAMSLIKESSKRLLFKDLGSFAKVGGGDVVKEGHFCKLQLGISPLYLKIGGTWP